MATANAMRSVPKTGVIYVTSRAETEGYKPGGNDWANLGQGQPETGTIKGTPPRVDSISIIPQDHEYAPVGGLLELRASVASLYNALYRRGLPSQYTAENVAISGGGRVSLTRAAAALGSINLGHFLPDYTAYEELLDAFRYFNPIPILLEGDRNYDFPPDQLEREIIGRGLSAILVSNPCNPTGKLIDGEEMAAWVAHARRNDCALLLDEFYSQFVWKGEAPQGVSAATCVEDVNEDPVLLFNGLTKNWRYPGWRVTWTLGPKNMIEAMTSAGSFLDGGGTRPMQRAAIPLLEEAFVRQESQALQSHFRNKKTKFVDRLRAMGIRFDIEPEGTFYAWGNLSHLPPLLNDGMRFFEAALKEKVIVVPGEFFDVNPGRRRPGRASRFRDYARFSFGPATEELERGLDGLERLISSC